MHAAEQPWLVLPSANEANCARTLPMWRAQGYRVAVLQDRVRFAADADVVLETDEYRGWPWAVNTLCRVAVPETARVVVAAGDDMLPDPTKTGPEIAAEYLARFPDGLGVMQPIGDGYLLSDTYCGSPWFGRGWIDHAFGGRGPIPGGYRHNWADMELHWVARGLGRLWARPDLTQPHEHFARTGDAAPEYWTRSARGFDLADCERFVERAWAGFPGADPVNADETSKYDHRVFQREYRSIAEVHLFKRIGRCAWDARRRMREAMALCERRGWTRVAVYGNGAHTEAVWDVIAQSPIVPTAILDDRAGETSERFGVPVCEPARVAEFDARAIVLSANSVEDELAEKAQRLGLPIVRLYGGASPAEIVESSSVPFAARAG